MARAPRKWTPEEIKEIRSSPDGIDKLRRRFGTSHQTIKLIKEATSEEDALAILSKKPQGEVLTADITGKEAILDGYKGYEQDKEAYLFIRFPNGRIRDFRLEEPLLYPIFQLMRNERGYKGNFPQFMADAVETLFANAGYELALVPKSQGVIYREVTKLVREGKLRLEYNKDGEVGGVSVPPEETNLSLQELCEWGNEIQRRSNEAKNERARGQASPRGEKGKVKLSRKGGGKKKPGESQ